MALGYLGFCQRLLCSFLFCACGNVPLVLEGNLGEGIVRVGQTLLDVPDNGRVGRGGLLALAILGLLLLQLLQALQVAYTGQVKNLEGRSEVVIILFLLFLVTGGL